ncbi:META domain-containing protein, partial [Deinococcus aquaticus]|uniref:META domain-containing protein n=1 Tax=Deinococcus aquaticus TaxID=328692 RepID=UPI003F44A578
MSALLTLTLAALTSLPAPTPAAPALATPTLGGTTWTLQTVQPAGSAPITPGAHLIRPTLTLTGSGADLTLGGSTGCSPLSGAARLGTTGPLKTATLLLRGVQGGSSQNCPDAALSLREDYLTLLRATTRYDLSGDTLTLIAGKGRLTFRAPGARAPAPTNTGASMNTSLNGAWTALRLSVAGRDVPTSGLLSVTFDGPKVTLGGSVGCNVLRGTGALLGSPARVTFGPVSSTRMACPPAQAKAETALLSLLRA